MFETSSFRHFSFNIYIAYVVCGIILFCVGYERYAYLTIPAQERFLYDRINTKITLIGNVVEEPEQTEYGERLYVNIVGFKESENTGVVSDTKTATTDIIQNEKILVSGPHQPSHKYGDQIKITGTLKLPEDFKGSTGITFPYVKYLEKKSVHFQFKANKIETVSSGHGNRLIAGLLYIKRGLLDHIRMVIPSPESGLLEGLILGENTLPKKQQDEFRIAGIVHIIVLSGYNMTLIATVIMAALSFLPFYVRLGGSAIGVVLFALMAGPTATVVRATLMTLIALTAKASGRLYDVLRALSVAAILMIIHNPLIVLYDPSFQLSFLATLGLIVFSPVCLWVFQKWPEWALKEVLVSTFATQIMVLPFLIHMTGSVSLISVIANCAVLPFLPLAMLFGAGAAMFSYISLYIATPFAYGAYLVLTYVMRTAHLFARIPYASVEVHISTYSMVSMYGLYGFLAILYMNILARNKKT